MDPQLDSLKWDANGLITAVVQDHQSGQVLVVCYLNREALQKTVESGKVHTFSRSRNRIALKGESSGHVQELVELLADCDKDAVVLRVRQNVAACHEGYYSCFYRTYTPGGDGWTINAKRVFDPGKVYGH